MNRRRIIRWACLLIALCAIILLRPKMGEVTLINQAGEEVVKTTVEINQQKFEFSDIPPGESRKLKCKIEPGTRYAISVEFRYDRKLDLQAGIFTGGEKSGHQLVIKTDGVVLESGND